MSCLIGHDVGFKIWEATEQQHRQIRGKVGAEASLRRPLCHVNRACCLSAFGGGILGVSGATAGLFIPA
jgi:hypothetical protein